MEKVAKVGNGYIVEQKVARHFCCKICDYTTSKKYNLTKHILTKKHMLKVAESSKNLYIFNCKCGKKYKRSQGLSKHKKKCKIECIHNVSNVSKNVSNVSKSEMSKMKCPKLEMSENMDDEKKALYKIIEKNAKEIKTLKNTMIFTLQDQLKTLTNVITKNGVCNSMSNSNTNQSHNVNSLNTQNNNLTVNVYLNEHCKNAMNIKDFVEKVKVSLEDLQYTTDNGFAKGISNIFMKQLNDMKPTERPIHCTDAKRCKFYVKDENNDWKKDAENKKINKSISDITLKQIKMLKVWEGVHPYWNSNTVLGMHRQEIICQIMGGRDMEAQNKNRKRIKQMVGATIKLKEAMAQVLTVPSPNVMNKYCKKNIINDLPDELSDEPIDESSDEEDWGSSFNG